MGTMHDNYFINTLADGDEFIIVAYDLPSHYAPRALPIPCTVWTVPGAGSTVAVSYSLDNGTTYTAWPNGAVTAASSDVLVSGITHIKFQQTVVGANSTVGAC